MKFAFAIAPGIMRGNHYHHTKHLVIRGEALI